MTLVADAVAADDDWIAELESVLVGPASLTPAERSVASLVAVGRTNAQIADDF